MTLRTDEIQSLLFTGFGSLGGSRILLLRARSDAAEGDARAALARVPVQFGRERVERAVQLALTPRGMQRLGLAQSARDSFPIGFREPVADAHRLRALGDQDANAPSGWDWSGDELDAALFVYAADDAAAGRLQAELFEQVAPAFELTHLSSRLLNEHKEHFGFRDGLSQPRIRELWPHDEEAVAAGELVLGYPDETGDEPPSPRDGDVDLGRDGTFVVLRQLEQDVKGFWDHLREKAGDDATATWLAAKMLGRWPDGTPTGRDGPGPQRRTAPYEDPSYRRDPHGLGIPKGAHIRRANPRDGLLRDPAASLAKVARHRLLRRGRPYGAPAPASAFPEGLEVTAAGVPPTEPEAGRGLLFVALCADLARQFELVQQTWLNNTKHDGLFDEACPIAAGRELRADASTFTIPEVPLRRRVRGHASFVRVRGSAYLFLPGRSALRHLLAAGS